MKDKFVRTRVDDVDFVFLKKLAKKENITMAEILRRLIQGKLQIERKEKKLI